MVRRHDVPSPIPSPSPLESFRSKPGRKKIHALEVALIVVVALQLVFLPWALGGMKAWSQWISLGLSALAFVISLVPRLYADAGPDRVPFKLYTWPKLRRFPIFWLGLLLFAYILTQTQNPAWIYASDARGWWLRAVEYKTWAPTGVDVPFAWWGPWRMLVIYGAVWLTVCASWIGFTRRRSLQILLAVLAGNAFALAILGLAQRALESNKMFFLFKAEVYYFVASFIYKNHAGAYFNLLLALCAGLSWWHYERAQRRLDKSSPSGVFAFFGTAAAMIVFLSYSRMATLLMAAMLLTLIGLFVWRHFFRVESERRNWWLLVTLVLLVGGFGRIGVGSVKTSRVIESFEALSHQGAFEPGNYRFQAARATWDMAKDKLVLGWGSGSWRFVFPKYQQHYPSIYMNQGKRVYWEHAHNDYLELLSEFGIVGCLIFVAGLGYAGIRLLRLHAWQNPLACCVVLGVLVTAAHSVVDFQFFNPAILTTWCVLLFLSIRWLEMEEA